MSLSLRQAQVQERIQHIRHALVELVHVFGTEILVSAQNCEVSSRPLSRRRVKMIDLVRGVFTQSGEWLTLQQIMELLHQQSDSALAPFINPGVAVSNAIRVLERRGEVEVTQDRQGTKWRFRKSAQSCTTRNTVAKKNNS
jgi:hypothetical protein